MKTFLVSSTVTFVPENYEAFVNSLADSDKIHGLILIENRDWKIVAKALALLLSGAAPRMGWHLLKNYFGSSNARKEQAFARNGKVFRVVSDINSKETLEFIKQENVELIVNARTRSFFKKNLLNAPRYGCINIHHGLLPEQRGLMCDFWAHMEKTSFGFSIHQMTSKLDDGPILHVGEVKTDSSNYMTSIFEGSLLESQAIENLLAKLAKNKHADNIFSGLENIKTQETKYRTNPSLIDFYKLQLRGTKI
ncbi:formyltransferase family protein [Bdellovibrio sp. HCB209]|uniref:formyltransferase family protein n=1 Tax=Bdellovibrio sp. HCB209 TaxID=3394354 RepID=UPI0039B64F7D